MNVMHLKVIVMLSCFFLGPIVLQCSEHGQVHFQSLPAKLIFRYFDNGSYIEHIDITKFYEQLNQLIL